MGEETHKFIISQNSSIALAMKVIDENKHGALFVVNEEDQVQGIATDGDIRRWLINNPDVNGPIKNCMNENFIACEESTPRESLLKLLDHKIKIIPVLGKNKKLLGIHTSKSFPIGLQKNVLVRSKSPVRISFGGGGTDLTHYFYQHGGAVLNATISLYSHCLLKKRNDNKITIESLDLKEKIELNGPEELDHCPRLPLIICLIKLIQPEFGFDLQIKSDFPVGSGLGGSAVVLSSIIGCFNQLREDTWDRYEVAELAFQAERLGLGVAGGWQDQYATVFGGFNFMEFTGGQNIVHPLRLDQRTWPELEENLILCYTGRGHIHNDIHDDQKKNMTDRKSLHELAKTNKELTYRMKGMLLRGNLKSFGQAMDQAWHIKKQFSSKISDPELDEIYDFAKVNGALGGKLLGAGGGGYFLFYAEPLKRHHLEKSLIQRGLLVQNFVFEDKGLQTWKLREER